MPPDPTLRLHTAQAEPLAVADACPPLQPLLIDIASLAVLLSRSVAALERDQAADRLPRALKLGRSKRWRLQEVVEWVSAGCPDRRTWEARRAK